MRAAVVREVGGIPEPGELPDPVPSNGEALVEVRAAALNPIDLAIASGRFYAGPPQVPYAPGREGVGVVRAAGTVEPGLRVRFERDATCESGENGCWRSPSPFFPSGSAQALGEPQVWG